MAWVYAKDFLFADLNISTVMAGAALEALGTVPW